MEERQLAEKEHKKEIEEQSYKLFMHLLNKSQFYSSYILTKIEKSIEAEKINQEKVRKRNEKLNKENKMPSKRKNKRAKLEKYDIRKYIPADVSNKKFKIL